MAVKLFVSDLDGTMLPDGNVVSAENIAAVRRAAEAGVTVTIATGRMIE
ncbi:MAG: HAD family hydrolase, partial [Centipeda sp. (in: firmicutes)]